MTSGGSAPRRKKAWIDCLALGLLAALLQASLLCAQEVVIQGPDQFSYAAGLMARGETDAAIFEFKRFLHLFPEDPQVPLARLNVGRCLLAAGRLDAARQTFDELSESAPEPGIRSRALLFSAEALFRQGALKQAEARLLELLERDPAPQIRDAALYRLGWVGLRAFRWEDAAGAFGRVQATSPLYADARELEKRALDGRLLFLKDPVTAGTLAALLPGLGHAYVNRYKDGIVALLLNGLFIWAALEAFHEDQEVLGGMLAFLELGWYSGNIYSAVNAAHKHNRKRRQDHLDSLQDLLQPLSLGTSRDGLVAGVTFRY